VTPSPDLLASATVLLACVGALLLATEMLALRSEVQTGGMFDRRILRTGQRWSCFGGRARALDVLLGWPGSMLTVALQALAVGLLLVPGTALTPLPWLLVVLACHLLLVVSLGYAADASDRMVTLVLAAAVAYHLAKGPLARDVALWFVGAQAVLAYSAAGWAKLSSPRWRSGEALSAILATRTFGHPRVASVVRTRPRLSRGLSSGIIAFECSAPIAVIGGVRTTVLFVGAALLMHLGIAAVMRLNHFVWAFAATYPGMIHLARSVDGFLGR
jgi:hypothetical protein